LGLLAKLDVLRAQDPSGSRYELGLGVDLKPPLAAELDQLRAKLIDPNRVAGNDPEVESLLRSLQPVPAAQDPDGEWLFHGCGLPTVHRVDTNTLYVSHFPTFGLVIAQGAATPAVPFPLEARYQAPGDPGSNAVLQAALAGATTQWASAGGEAFSILSDAAARTRWHQPAQPVPAAQTIFLAAGLPAVANLAQVAPQLDALPPELLETIRLGPVLTGQIMAGHPASADTLRTLAGILANQSISSILPLVTAPNEILLVLGVIGLPVAGINLSDRRSTGFRWYIVPLEGPPGQIKTIGSRSAWTPDQPALVAIVVVGYARRGLVDPYEVRVEAPAQGLLNLPQYEFLMNLLEQVYPVGILVNTFALRQGNVDLDGDGHADPLPPALSRTYRRFHRPRHSGEVAVNIAVNP
jgi:hypothetical protein